MYSCTALASMGDLSLVLTLHKSCKSFSTLAGYSCTVSPDLCLVVDNSNCKYPGVLCAQNVISSSFFNAFHDKISLSCVAAKALPDNLVKIVCKRMGRQSSLIVFVTKSHVFKNGYTSCNFSPLNLGIKFISVYRDNVVVGLVVILKLKSNNVRVSEVAKLLSFSLFCDLVIGLFVGSMGTKRVQLGRKSGSNSLESELLSSLLLRLIDINYLFIIKEYKNNVNAKINK